MKFKVSDWGFAPADWPRPWQVVLTLAVSLTLAALLFQFAVYAHYTVSLLRFPFDYDQGEGFELYDTLLHARGEWPYQDSQVFPFYTSIYPPLFHLMTVPLVWVFGPHLWTGRLVGFLASLTAAGAIGWGVHRASQNKIIAAFSGLAFLASNYTFHIGPLFRQHMSMVMFETLAMVTLAQWGGKATTDYTDYTDFKNLRQNLWLKNSSLLIGLFFLLCAGYAKQLALATVLAGLGYLFLRGPKRALLSGLSLAIIAGGIFLYINWATDGWWYISIIKANINAYDINQAISLYKQWFGLHLVLAVGAFAGLIYETYFARLSAYSVWFFFAFANGALSGKFGAGESYFVTTTAAACVLSGMMATKVWGWAAAGALEDLPRVLKQLPSLFINWSRGFSRKLAKASTPESLINLETAPSKGGLLGKLIIVALPLLYLVQVRLTLHTYTDGLYAPLARALTLFGGEGNYYDSQGYTQLGPRPTPSDHANGQRIADLARTRDNPHCPVFSEEAAFLIVAGKPVVTNAFPQLVMYQAGLFDPAREIEMISQKAFCLVIFRAQFYPPPVLQAIGANYQPLTEINMNGFVYRILEPRP